MNAVLADLYQQTGDSRWLTVAQRFDHATVFNPLAANQDQQQLARLYRHRKRLHRQPGPLLQRSRPQLHRLLEHQRPGRGHRPPRQLVSCRG